MVLSAAIAAVLLMQATPGPPSEADLRNAPHWIQLPTAAEVQGAYPALAKRGGVKGEAVLACTLDADGWLRACRVASETPVGYGFGPAALTLAGRFRMSPLTAAGDSVDGRPIEAPIWFGPKRRR
jgi:TonB family protein